MNKVCFMGLGYIGLPTAIVTAKSGLSVLGVDIDPSIVTKTNAGQLHFIEDGMEGLLREVLASGAFRASQDIEESDAYLIVVPTPFKGNHEPDVSYVQAATRSIIPFLKEGDLFIIESTSPIGTTEKIAELIYHKRPELSGKLHIAYCPERILPGNVLYELEHNDRVIGGITPEATERAKAFYAHFVKGALHGTNARTAELCKLTENASRDVQIAFANELSLICDKSGVNVWELIELANKHPRVNILQPGSGVGGHCIAVDPYFIYSAFPLESKLISSAREINNYKAFWCVEKVLSAVRDFKDKHGRGLVLAMMGLAFKPDIDDLRESPAGYIANHVLQDVHDAEVLVSEPNISEHDDIPLTDYRRAYEEADIVAFLTAHTPFKSLGYRSDKVILDFCGIFRR